jgi:DNA-binding beta-propeller fold protein YncE
MGYIRGNPGRRFGRGRLLREMTLLLALLSAVLSMGQDVGPLLLEKEIALPGVEGRIDHFSVDVPDKRLFIAALENGSVEILDTRQGERTAEIKGLEEPQGIYYDSKTGRLYVATGGDGKLRIYDEKSLTVRETFEFGGDADNVRYDQQTGDIWVGYGNGGIGIVNSTGQNVGSVALGTHPESFQFEQNGDRVYVNVPKQFGITVVNRKKRAVTAKWALGGLFANYSMALDDANKRLFVGCRFPARLVVLDTISGRIVTSLPTVGDTDDVFYDPGRRLVYVIGGEGAVEVLGQHDPDHYERVGRIPTAPGARTGLFVRAFNRLYVAVPHRGSQAAKVLVYMMK